MRYKKRLTTYRLSKQMECSNRGVYNLYFTELFDIGFPLGK